MEAALGQGGVAKWALMPPTPARSWRTAARGTRSVCISRGCAAPDRRTCPRPASSCAKALIAPPFWRRCSRSCALHIGVLALEEGDQRWAKPCRTGGCAMERCGLDECPMVALAIAVSATLRGRAWPDGGGARLAAERAPLLAEIADPSPWYESECRILLRASASAERADRRLGNISGPPPQR